MTIQVKDLFLKKTMQFFHNLTFAYAIAVALAGDPKDISIAGFDGLQKNQREQIEIQKTIKLILQHNKFRINSLTKTGYKLKIRNENIRLYSCCTCKNASTRLPGKPLRLIDGLPMIVKTSLMFESSSTP